MSQSSNEDTQEEGGDFDGETGELNLWCEAKTFAKLRQFILSEYPDLTDVPADDIRTIVIEDLSKMPPLVGKTEEAVMGYVACGVFAFLAFSALLGMGVIVAWLAGYFSN